MTEPLFGAIDIGGTKLAVGIVDAEGRVLSHVRESTRPDTGPEPICARLVEMLHRAVDEAGIDKPLLAVGVGCGGPLDRASGTILTVPNLPGWEDFPLRGFFEERLNLPVTLDNDANAAGLGEALFGAGRSHSHVCYFTVSTGVGGGIIVDGKLYRGVTEMAGEFGHQIIVPDGPPCPCGGRGCLEALASGTSIARRAREGLASGAKSSVTQTVEGDLSRVTAALLAEAACEGDPFARQLWEETGYYLGLGVVNAIHFLNPSVVIIGGGVSLAGDLLFDLLRRTVRDRAMKPLASACQIVPASLANDVGIVGAAALAIEAFHPSGVFT